MFGVITNSSAGCARTCLRKYYLRNILEIVSRSEKPALEFGTSTHSWLGPWWIGNLYTEIPRLSDRYQQAKLASMLGAYALRWGEWHVDNTSEIKIEQEALVPLINPDTGKASTYWQVAVKLDAIGLIGGQLQIVEHKTTSDSIEQGATYFERLRIDSQISTYMMAARELGYGEPTGVLYDVLRKPQLKPFEETKDKKYTKSGSLYANQHAADETPEEFRARCTEEIASNPNAYFAHLFVVRLESEIEESARDLWTTAAIIRECDNHGRWPRNSSACYNYKSFCEYWPICSGRCKPDDSTYFEERRAHSEISKETLGL
jgi:hypothetical protein